MKIKIITIFCCFLFFLPFTQALTVNIGFPLKISELILSVLIFIFIAKLIPFKKFKPLTKVSLVILMFLVWASLSFVINSFWQYPYPLKTIPFRISAIGDSFLRLCYIVLNILGFFISVIFLRKNPNILKYWIYGAIIASIYSWYLFLFSSLNLPYVKLFGMEDSPQSLNGFIRCGTFKEGNFLGLYLLLSAIISFYLQKKKTGIFLLLTIATTFSTITIISTIVFLVFIIRKSFLKIKTLKILIIIMPFMFLACIYTVNTPYFQTYVYAKINSPSNVLNKWSFSKVDRTLTARIGYFQGVNNMFFGVGPFNYGLHYDKYNDFKTFILNNNEWSLSFFLRENRRRIANNVYIEVFAEYGFFGFFIFIIFLIKILRLAIRNQNDLITGGIIAILISFNAFPSFIMLFVWVFLAIPAAFENLKLKENND
tara:strand:- start:377 stop:1657 length:1281 start_codon:yes stop_codon:yes gene_type:complete